MTQTRKLATLEDLALALKKLQTKKNVQSAVDFKYISMEVWAGLISLSIDRERPEECRLFIRLIEEAEKTLSGNLLVKLKTRRRIINTLSRITYRKEMCKILLEEGLDVVTSMQLEELAKAQHNR